MLRYRGQAHDPQGVRRDDMKVRLSAELYDCESVTTIWTDRFAYTAADLLDLQDELSVRVAATIAPQVQESELGRSRAKHPASLDGDECAARAGSTFHGERFCEGNGTASGPAPTSDSLSRA